MGKVWVLDTETKGTGAEMLPLERVEYDRDGGSEPIVVGRRSPRQRPVKAKEPRRFRVVDVLSGEVLLDDAGARETVEALGGIRSIVDVGISEWDAGRGRWRPLTFGERKALWERRSAATAPTPGYGASEPAPG